MNSLPLFCSKLSQNINQILDLIGAESKIQQKDILKVEASLKKAIAPKFEIVFARAFSANKRLI